MSNGHASRGGGAEVYPAAFDACATLAEPVAPLVALGVGEVTSLCAALLDQVSYVINHPEEGWEGDTGFINKEVIQRRLFPPGEGVKIVVCGPWKMCQIMKSVLKEAGYTDKVCPRLSCTPVIFSRSCIRYGQTTREVLGIATIFEV